MSCDLEVSREKAGSLLQDLDYLEGLFSYINWIDVTDRRRSLVKF